MRLEQQQRRVVPTEAMYEEMQIIQPYLTQVKRLFPLNPRKKNILEAFDV